jgi:hypothetical protein
MLRRFLERYSLDRPLLEASPSSSELAAHLLTIEPRPTKRTKNEGDMLLCQILRPMPRQGYLDTSSLVLHVSAHSALETVEAVVQQPGLHLASSYLAGHEFPWITWFQERSQQKNTRLSPSSCSR